MECSDYLLIKLNRFDDKAEPIPHVFNHRACHRVINLPALNISTGGLHTGLGLFVNKLKNLPNWF